MTSRRVRFLVVVCALLTLVFVGSVHAQDPSAPATDVQITRIAGNLYRVRDGDQHTVFLTTTAGIVVVDPLTRPAALALKQHLDRQFPGLPVRYVVLTHHHLDRAEGASVFLNAQAVGQREYNDALAASRRNMPDEYRFVRDVRVTFDNRGTVAVGDTTVELAHVRSPHAREMAIVHFPAERIVFASDPPPLTTTPFLFDSTTPGEIYSWLDAIRPMAPETLVFGNGLTMSGAAFEQLADYLMAVRSQVAEGYERGRSLGELQVSPLASAHAGQPHYAARISHIEAVYRNLRLFRIEASGRGILNYSQRNGPVFCADAWTTCAAGGAVAGGTGALAVTFGTRFGAAVEATAGQQYWGSRTRPSRDEEIALRQSRVAVLLRVGAIRPGGVSFVPTAGLSRTRGDVRGLSLTRGLLAPAGGFHPIQGTLTTAGLTAGVDVAFTTGRGLSVIVPVRVTRLIGDQPEFWPAMADVQVGIGMSLPLVRRVGMR